MLLLDDMQKALRIMVLHVRTASDGIVHASTEIAEGSMDLSARTEQTAANLEESAASMEQIGATVRNTADHTSEASRIAGDNALVAQRGGEVMGQMVATMEQIHASSSRIADIIGTIDGIAFQTNILALNAAVEAARAGEHGRGFAVVASEVRALAQRSAGAAAEVRTLINDSVERVQTGTGIVREAGGTIGEVVGGAQRIRGLLEQVRQSAQEQAQGVAQVGEAVQDLDRSTQQNAALVEQTAAAASSLKDQAMALAAEVARFRLPEGSAPMAGSARAMVAKPAADFNFDTAIEAHRQWKVKLRTAIANRERLDADTICRDDRCPLGQWLHGEGGRRWGHSPGFVSLIDGHRRFHEAAGAVAREINAGRYDEAERLLRSGTDFAHASTEVGTLLTRAKRGL